MAAFLASAPPVPERSGKLGRSPSCNRVQGNLVMVYIMIAAVAAVSSFVLLLLASAWASSATRQRDDKSEFAHQPS